MGKPTVKPNEFHKKFHDKLAELKKKFGTGAYLWAEGMNRQSARKIARKLARKELKGGVHA